jgi:hypothetical protein
MKKLLMGLVLVVFALQGCALFNGDVPSSPIAQVATQYAIIKFVADDAERQAKALEIINRLQKYTESSSQLTVGILTDLAAEWVPWEELDPADQFLLNEMLKQVALALKEQVGDDLLDEEALIKTREFLSWMGQAVAFSMQENK